jgi:phosphoesterase RecJ-like protein
MTTRLQSNREACAAVCEALGRRERLAITSHLRPDGDAIGSEIALALALEAQGKTVRVVNVDKTPPPFDELPCVDRIEIADRIGEANDGVVVLECGGLDRTGLTDLEGRFIINIDHHLGNTPYGAVNWYDVTSASCGEMVFDVIEGLGARLTPDIATHLYIAILTDTGSFRYSALSRRTYEVAGRLVEAGADPITLGRLAFDSNSVGRLRLFGMVMAAMQIDASGQIASLHLDHATAAASGGSFEDTDGLANLPLTVRTIQAVAFFKQDEAGQYRVSLRSKGEIDVGSVARQFGGGGHRNAAGCSVAGSLEQVRASILGLVRAAVDAGLPGSGTPVSQAPSARG